MDDKELLYDPPIDLNGKPYWIPVVMKNKDSLVSFLNGMYFTCEQIGIDPDGMSNILSSERFNDILRDGRRAIDISDDEFKDYVKDYVVNDIVKNMYKETHEECHPDILSEYFLPISCQCGNFYGFKEINDIPDEQLKCGICDKVILDYTGHHDDEYAYDGVEKDLETVMMEVRQELDLDDDDEEEDDLGF
jgi:hypothetical protein